MMNVDLFLNAEEVHQLTGFKRKTKQIQQIKKMGIPFFINATNRPIVSRSVVDGSAKAKPPKTQGWQPAL